MKLRLSPGIRERWVWFWNGLHFLWVIAAILGVVALYLEYLEIMKRAGQ